nr:A-kinase anchor protein 17B-like isoform X2 [Geotrypetes seraphini]XP_033802160.1 A-kinase anchor protein 17B-like isoform X2 [Geotrypetes seraphini]XP_033802162.1 A-kinase anchor protein 17B-like isoform X2 [Geotrypetes seraphini]XP_033802163.1 A-kinase anchor protein 17B-like isoform X2 [Geotrypetes seraphini]
MTVTIVYDNSEAVELCTSQSLYLTPVARLIINVMLPDCKEPGRSFSNWDILDQLKTMISPDQFSSLRVSKSTKEFVRIEGEAETKHLAQTLQEKLHGTVIKINGFLDGLHVETTEACVDFPTPQDWEAFSKETTNEEIPEQSSTFLPDSIYLEGLPCKWFALKGTNSEKPNEAVLQIVFESFGKVKNTDIPMLDPYREENASGNSLGGIQTFAAFIQYEDHADFVKAMEALRGMKLMYQGEDGKALACNMKVTFDATKHFSEEAIKKRNLERQKLQELEQQRKLEKEEEEAAERKRKYEEKKAQARKRKARLKKKEQRQRQKERQEKQLKVSQEVKAEDEQWLDESEEWEARKLLLAQRRVASLRLLTLLLAQIKEFVELNRMNEELLLDIEMEDELSREIVLNELNEQKRKGILPPPPDEELDTEVKSKCQLPRKGKSRKREKQEGGDKTKMLASSQSLRTLSKEHVKKETLKKNKQNGSLGCTSLQITFNQDCKEIQFFDRENYHICHISHPRKVPEPSSGKKPKVYETDEFIHYLLNYYQCPSYARICPEPSDTVSSSWWQRVVFHSGKGFRVLLKNTYERHFTQLNVERKTAQGIYYTPQEDDYRNWKFTVGRPDRNSDSKPCTRGFSKNEFQRQWSQEEFTESCGSPRQAPGHSVGHSPSQGSHRKRNPEPSYESMNSAYELRDVLEEISSDSEYFSEERSGSERRRKGGCRGKENPAVRNRACVEMEKPSRPYPQNPESRKHDLPDLILPFGFPHQERRNPCQCQLRKSCRHEEQKSESGSSQDGGEITTCTRKRKKGQQATDLGEDDPCFEPEYLESSRHETEWGNTLWQKTTLKSKAALIQKTPSQYRISSRVLDLWDSEYMYNKEDTNDCINPANCRQSSEHSPSYRPNHTVGKRTSGSCPKSFREFLRQGHCFYST